MNAIVLSIGDELALGQTVDTNSAWLSGRLAGIGWSVAAHVTVPDDQRTIEQALRELAPRCQVLLVSGGLGPTADDLTRPALAAFLRQPLELNQAWLDNLELFFQQRGRPMPQSNRDQAMVPRGCRMIWNHNGTAPGIQALGAAQSAQPSADIFVMPGVPSEMKAMFIADIAPLLEKRGNGAAIRCRSLHTFGLGESTIGQMLGDLMRRDRNPSVGTTVSNGLVSLRINSRFATAAEAQSQLEQTGELCRQALGDLIFGADEQTLVGAVIELLAKDPTAQKYSPAVATAESCTGGLLAAAFTELPGSSQYFRQGYVTYTNQAKTDLLHVPAELINGRGAVSEAVAEAMARGAQQQSGAPYALAITGVAGPDGGSEQKPVGTVCICLAHPGGLTTRRFQLPGQRGWVRDRSVKMALSMLRYQLLNRPMPW